MVRLVHDTGALEIECSPYGSSSPNRMAGEWEYHLLGLSYCLKEYDCNMKTIDPHKAIDFMLKNAGAYAKAKAEVTYLEEFRKSKKAILFARATGNTIADRENYAYAHPEYREVLKGLQEAVERAEALKWELVAAQARIDVWRSQEASNRAIDRNTQ
jgi:hypothetical protein